MVALFVDEPNLHSPGERFRLMLEDVLVTNQIPDAN